MSLGALFLERCAEARSVFVVDREGPHAYADVERHAIAIAARIGEVAAPGARVAILLGAGEPFVAAFFGALLAGCTAMPIDPRLAPPEIAFLLEHGDVAALVTDARISARCALVSAERGVGDRCVVRSVAEEDVAVMLPTSGSTASPRVVELSHASVLANARAWNARYAIDGADVIATPLSPCHSFGMTACLLSALDAGATLVVCDDPLPASVGQAIASCRATVFVAASSFYGWLARSPAVESASLSTLRLAMSGACALTDAARDGFEHKTGLRILETYGLTEASPVVTATRPGEARAGSVGAALDVTLRVRDDELEVRGATVMRGYFRNAEATARALDDGWLRTGDLASIEGDRVTILGRRKDLIIRGGEKIYPEEIEGVLASHPGVIDVAVIGDADPSAGEIPIAFVAGSADASSLLALCRARLAAFKVPRRIEIVSVIPRNPNGKVLRRLLRERAT
ncbi:MAG: AMP-binding protein [Labilithrix sp.]|nr:AMP-binding protein [Labilithrix sp.]